jgi:glucose/sorbosone dehydrogenase
MIAVRSLRRAIVSLVLVGMSSTVLTSCHGLPHAHAVMTGLAFPAGFTIDPDGHQIWYAERYTGEIRRRDLRGGEDTLVWTVTNVLTAGEQGLLGLALHPNWPSSPFLYAYASRNVGGARNQILKISLFFGVGVAQQVIMDDPGIATVHNGGRIKFGPDGNLYAVIGEHANAANAQSIFGNANLAGKVLRMTPNGGVPAGNPFTNSFVWAYGIRNSYGFTFDPGRGNLWLTDNGPTCNDEVNRIVKAGNYSWGAQATCATPPNPPLNTNQSGPSPRRQPQKFYSAQGITGTAFCSRCGLGTNLDGRLFSTVNNGQLHSLTLDGTRTAVVRDDIVYDHPSGILSIETRGPGQPVYFSDSTAIYQLTVAG